jgi:DNA-binding MarR family transcriptional regulator
MSAADLDALDLRIARMDRSSPTGPWVLMTLRCIAQRPGQRAGDLAEFVGLDRDTFKRNVRKLKSLGLTESLEVGYRLSPRGSTYLSAGRE